MNTQLYFPEFDPKDKETCMDYINEIVFHQGTDFIKKITEKCLTPLPKMPTKLRSVLIRHAGLISYEMVVDFIKNNNKKKINVDLYQYEYKLVILRTVGRKCLGIFNEIFKNEIDFYVKGIRPED